MLESPQELVLEPPRVLRSNVRRTTTTKRSYRAWIVCFLQSVSNVESDRAHLGTRGGAMSVPTYPVIPQRTISLSRYNRRSRLRASARSYDGILSQL